MEPDPTPINPNPINPTNPNPPSKGLTALEKTLIGLGIALVLAIPLGYLLTRRTNKKRSN
jgi:ABC-type nitrate/sulfonate/bicarbonate transport system permease component